MKTYLLKLTYSLLFLLLVVRVGWMITSHPVENRSTANPTRSTFAQARKSLSFVFQQTLSPNEAGLVSGILLGEKDQLSLRATKQIRFVGLTHIIVASGTNLIFVVGLLTAVLKKMANRPRALIVLGVVIFYSLLTGFDPPIVRAALMVGLVSLAKLTGRPHSSYLIVLLAAVVMITLSPELLWSISFQLSFAATIGQIFLGRLATKLPILANYWLEILLTTVFAQVFTFPIVMVNFGSYSLVSVLVNILVVWTVPWIMTLSVVAGIISLVSVTMGRVFILPVHALAYYFWTVVEYFSKSEDLVINVKNTDLTASFIYYLFLILLILSIEDVVRHKVANLLSKYVKRQHN